MKHLLNKIPRLNTIVRRMYKCIKVRYGSYRLDRITNKKPLKLVIGASGICDAGWVKTNIDYLNLLNPGHWESHFRENQIDAMLAEHVWEHLTADEGYSAAQRCFKYLRPGGYLRAAVPDGFHQKNEYIECVRPGGIGAGADDHKILYNHASFADIFEKAGFRVYLLEYFDSERKFHYADWSPSDGKINRSMRFDKRNPNGLLNYTSIILDAYKEPIKSTEFRAAKQEFI